MTPPPTAPHALPRALWNADAEHAVLGACLLDADAIVRVRPVVGATDFYLQAHQHLFTALGAMHDAGDVVDPLTLAAHLDARATLEAVGGKVYIAYLIDAVPTAVGVEHHARLVRATAQRRQLAEVAGALLAAAEDPVTDVADLATRAAADLLPFAAAGDGAEGEGDGFRPADERLWPVMETIEARGVAAREGRLLGVVTGFPELDDLFHGWRPGELIVIGAGPKHGKSTLAFNILRHVVETQAAGVVTAEMTRDEVVEGLLSMESGVPRLRLASGRLWDDDWPKLARAAGVLRAPLARLHLDDVAFPSIEQVVTRCTRLKAQHPEIALLIVDYLQLITNPMKGRRGDEEINAVCVALKGLAKRLGIPVLAPAQTNYKDTDRRATPAPTLADLQGGSGMAQTANFVLLAHRPGLYEPMGSDDRLVVELAASRRTDRATVTLAWDGARMRVESPRLRAAASSAASAHVGRAA